MATLPKDLVDFLLPLDAPRSIVNLILKSETDKLYTISNELTHKHIEEHSKSVGSHVPQGFQYRDRSYILTVRGSSVVISGMPGLINVYPQYEEQVEQLYNRQTSLEQDRTLLLQFFSTLLRKVQDQLFHLQPEVYRDILPDFLYPLISSSSADFIRTVPRTHSVTYYLNSTILKNSYLKRVLPTIEYHMSLRLVQ